MRCFLIIIPCFNEEMRLPIDEFKSFMKLNSNECIKFLFVNDGSVDNTDKILFELEKEFENVSVLSLNKNEGKAEAIRSGVLHKLGEEDLNYIGYFDADLAAPLDEIFNLIKSISKGEPYMIMGARVKLLGSTFIERKLSRHYIGRIFATIVGNMLKLPIYDTQCGAKLIRFDVAQLIFKEKFLSKWLFDVELLFRIKKHYSKFKGKIIEVPLKKWEDKNGSKINFSYYFQAPLDLLRIFFFYNK